MLDSRWGIEFWAKRASFCQDSGSVYLLTFSQRKTYQSIQVQKMSRYGYEGEETASYTEINFIGNLWFVVLQGDGKSDTFGTLINPPLWNLWGNI